MLRRTTAFCSPWAPPLRRTSAPRRQRHEHSTAPVSPRCNVDTGWAATSSKRGTAITWNVNSIRALLRKNPRALQDLVDEYDPDVLCLQETKLQKIHEELFMDILEGYETVVFNSSSARLGYSGTVTYAKRRCQIMQRGINDKVGDDEGRLVTVEFPGAHVVNVYTMNAGTGFKRLENRLVWDSSFRKHLRYLRRTGKPVVVLGDLNVAREDVDVHSPKTMHKLPGFSDEERGSFEDTLEVCGMVDAYRMLNPDTKDSYTFWDYKSRARGQNRGWRIDYALVSDDMVGAVYDVQILDKVMGSDHCPVAIELSPGLL